eukprot:15471063-Alexandrium_andersonii.AAC.1
MNAAIATLKQTPAGSRSTELRNARGASGKRVLKRIMRVNVGYGASDLRRFRVRCLRTDLRAGIVKRPCT